MGQRMMADDAEGNPKHLEQTDGALHTKPLSVEEQVLELRLVQVQQMETLNAMLVELRTITHFIQTGLNVSDSPETVRRDQSNPTLPI